MQPWHTPFPIWNQSVVPCPLLTVASWPAYRFLRSQVRWSGIPISFRIFQFVVIYTVKGSGIINKAEIDVFLELSCFFDDPTDVGNLISGFSAFSKSSLNIWKFMVHVLLKLGLENFEHYFASMWKKESESHSVMSSSLRPHGLYSSCNSLGQNTVVGNLFLLQGIFPTQGSNLHLLCLLRCT